MTDRDGSDSSMLPIVLALGVALLISIAINLLQYQRQENWKRRWHEDTRLFSVEIKDAAQKIAELSVEKIRLESELAALKAAAGK